MKTLIVAREQKVIDAVMEVLHADGFDATGTTDDGMAGDRLANGDFAAVVIGGGVEDGVREVLRRSATIGGARVVEGALGGREVPDYVREAIEPQLDDTGLRSWVRPVSLFGASGGYGTVENLFAVADPTVAKFGDQWWMYFGAMHTAGKVSIFSAALPPGAPLSDDRWSITTDASDPARATSMVEQPPEGAWDEWMHTPNLVNDPGQQPGNGGARPTRLYYTGSRAVGQDGTRRFSIGLLTRTRKGWVRRTEPILVGSAQRPSVSEPKVSYLNGKWRMWYRASTDQDDTPNGRIEYVESDDGIGGWSEPQEFFPEGDHYFDAAVTSYGDRYRMIAAKAPNVEGGPGFPNPGLWALASHHPSGDRSLWTREPVPLVDPHRTEPWHANGIWGHCLAFGDTPIDEDTLYVFFSGAAAADPHPWILSIGRFALPGTNPSLP